MRFKVVGNKGLCAVSFPTLEEANKHALNAKRLGFLCWVEVCT